MTIKQLASELREKNHKHSTWLLAKKYVQGSAEYIELQERIHEMNKQLLDFIPESEVELHEIAELEKQLALAIHESGEKEYEGYTVKYSKKNKLDVQKFLENCNHTEVLKMCKIPMKVAKEYAKLNPSCSDCIEQTIDVNGIKYE